MMQPQRVGIATFHYSYNEGAILQSVASAQTINNFKGVTGEVIDQRYPAKEAVYGAPNDDRKRALLNYVDHHLTKSDKQFHAGSDLSGVYNYINTRYDHLLIGSDVVWTLRYAPLIKRSIGKKLFLKQRSPFFTPFPNLYWPSEKLTIPSYSYAAAIGTLEYTEIPKRDRIKLLESLRRLSKISVRDERTRRFVEFLDPGLAQDVSLVPDPTFALPLDYKNLEKLKEKLMAWGVDFDRPICCFIASNDPQLRTFADYLTSKGYQTISLSTHNNFTELSLSDKSIDPIEWSIIFKLFDFCVTERMHGAIFCMKNLLPFIAIDINETEVDNDSKMVSLMRDGGLEDFLIPKSGITFSNLEGIFRLLNSDVESWEGKVEARLVEAGQVTRAYLSQLFA